MALAKHLKVKTDKNGVPIKDTTWGKIIEGIDNALQAKIKTCSPRKSETHSQLKLFQTISRAFGEIKDLWRNPVSHGTKTWDAGEVEVIYNHVKTIMMRLPPKIRERP
jgi:hypothetical protein